MKVITKSLKSNSKITRFASVCFGVDSTKSDCHHKDIKDMSTQSNHKMSRTIGNQLVSYKYILMDMITKALQQEMDNQIMIDLYAATENLDQLYLFAKPVA